MADERFPAIWQGPYNGELPDMSVIYPGEEHLVTAEDLKSDHWKAVDEPAQTPAAASTFGSGTALGLGSSTGGADTSGEDDEEAGS